MGNVKNYVQINFRLEPELHRKLMALCTHRGDKNYLLQRAVEMFVRTEGERIKKFNKFAG